MLLLDHTRPTIFENLALDEALLLASESGEGGETLRFWESQTLAVVLGASGVVANDVDVEACERDGVPIARRASGGGTVLVGPGCLCFTLILDMERRPELRGVSESYCRIMPAVSAALGQDVHCAGSSDLAWGSLKVSGNAQKRGRRFLLHHGTLLHGFDLSLFGRYLKQPAKQPEYRQGRPHHEFVANLPLPAKELKKRLAAAWEARDINAPLPEAEAARLAKQRYADRAWIWRR